MPSPRRAFLHLVTCVAIALGIALCEVWGLGPRQRRGLPRVEIQLDLDRLEAQIRILSSWFRRGKRRPRYSRREVLLILEHRERWGLSATEVAREFLVSSATVYHWLYRRREGSLEMAPDKPVPPCRRIADSRRLLVAEMALAGFEGDRTIERHLHLQGEKISARSVRRFRQNPLSPREEGKTRRRKRAKEIPALVDACAGQAASRDDVGRPRMARLLRALAEAFAEGIAADTLRRLDEGSVSEVEHARLRSRRTEQLAILHGRFRRIPPRHRPRYTSTERADILALKHRFRLSNKIVAGWFLLDPDTLCDWNRDVDHPEERQRPLVEPIADLEAAVARVALPPVPRRLEGEVVDTLAALAVKAPARKRRTRRKREERSPAAGAAKPRRLPPIHARHPNHYWSSDLTTLQLARTFWLASVIDLYSRDVLAWDLFTRQPSGEDVTALFHGAVARYDKPKHFVSDRGGQFVGEALATTLSEHGVDHRRGAVGQHGSIAIIERLWRSTKEYLDLKAVRPNVPAILRDRVGVVIDYYRTKRPHSAVGNATPNQVHRGESSRAYRATPAPRGWHGEPSPPPSFTIRHAFPAEKELPYLQPVA